MSEKENETLILEGVLGRERTSSVDEASVKEKNEELGNSTKSRSNSEPHNAQQRKETFTPHLRTTDTIPEDQAVQKFKNNVLEIEVVEGRNLAKKDVRGLSDPYVIVYLHDTDSKYDEKETFQTDIKLCTLNPKWNQKFVLPVPENNNCSLKFFVWDYDRLTKDDFMGLVEIPWPLINEQVCIEGWMELLERKNKKDKVSGEIYVKITVAEEKDPRILHRKVNVEDFELMRVIGRGRYGKVMQVRLKQTGQIFAMKVIKKADVVEEDDIEQAKCEKAVLQRLKNPFLVNLHYSFQSDQFLYLVMDFACGGELFNQIEKSGRLTEKRARLYAAETICALESLHKHEIIYRDLKPENILIGIDGHVKLCDFGLAKIYAGQKSYTFCGTPEYVAPEMLMETGYDFTLDWWSLGILIYEMLVGNSPFVDDSYKKVYDRVLGGNIEFPHFVSPVARDLISGLLEKHPKQRLGFNTVQDIKDHPFFQHLDWIEVMNKRVRPVMVPSVNSDIDLRYFDDDVIKQPIKESPDVRKLTSEDQKLFKGFTWYGDDFVKKNTKK